jgi:hypothetical protein
MYGEPGQRITTIHWISRSPAALSGFLQQIHHIAFTFFRRPKTYCNVTVMGGEVALP